MRVWLFVLTTLLGFSGAARAVYVNPEGQGQALIFPYYTAQTSGGNPFNTYITLVNRSSSTLVRVRFREGRGGREVASFNLRLDLGRAWAAAVVPTSEGARLITADGSCVSPAFASASGSMFFMDFTSSAYSGGNSDGFGDGLDRTREGYVEVIGMASVDDFGQILSCEAMRANSGFSFGSPPSNSLSGTLTVINVASGMDFTVNAEALAAVTRSSFYRPASDAYPDWNIPEIDPVAAFASDGTLYRTVWSSGLDAIEAALMRATVENEVILDVATRSATDWVVTLPTKRFRAGTTPSGPFANIFAQPTRDIPVEIQFVSRGGDFYRLMQCQLLCLPNQYSADMRLQWASSVLSFRAVTLPSAVGTSDVFGSRNAWIVNLPTSAQAGAASLEFGATNPHGLLSFQASTIRLADGATGSGSFVMNGLPALGFMARTFVNGTLACDAGNCQGNYGGSFSHKYRRRISGQ